MSRTLLIEPRDPVIFRDGKPFGATDYAKSLPFATPSVIAGSIRTRVGEGSEFDAKTVSRLLEIPQAGPFLACPMGKERKWQLAFPAPADAVAYPAGKSGELLQYDWLEPIENRWSDMPDGLLTLSVKREDKPAEKAPRFWYASRLLEWLKLESQSNWTECEPTSIGPPALSIQKRVHVSIEQGTQAAAEGQLFTTESLEFQNMALVSQIDGVPPEEFPRFPAISPLGGESRLAIWSEVDEETVGWPKCPALKRDAKRVRVTLATPAVFDRGWKPKWLEDNGSVPGQNGLRLRLRAAAVPRAMALSGWNYQTKGPKPTRFLAPSGSVYFFEVMEGDPRGLWLKSICDQQQDRLDGFGLALIGEW